MAEQPPSVLNVGEAGTYARSHHFCPAPPAAGAARGTIPRSISAASMSQTVSCTGA